MEQLQNSSHTTISTPRVKTANYATTMTTGSYEEPGLTKAQLTARKGPFQKLPVFTGRPEKWPLFYSTTATKRVTGRISELLSERLEVDFCFHKPYHPSKP